LSVLARPADNGIRRRPAPDTEAGSGQPLSGCRRKLIVTPLSADRAHELTGPTKTEFAQVANSRMRTAQRRVGTRRSMFTHSIGRLLRPAREWKTITFGMNSRTGLNVGDVLV
jgi:hypothetical protein